MEVFRVKIAVSGNKDDFAERLRNYCEKYPTDGVEVFLAGSQDADVVVTEEEEVCPDGVFHIVWTEVEEQKELPDKVFKYQAASRIISDICDRYNVYLKDQSKKAERKTKVWLISGCERQSGTTTVTEAIARFLEERDMKILCWNMEEPTEKNGTDCREFYEGLADQTEWTDRLKGAIQMVSERRGKIEDTYGRRILPALEGEQARDILAALMGEDQWDHILIQGLDALCPVLCTILELAEKHIWIHCGTPRSNAGFEQYRQFAPVWFSGELPEDELIYNMLDETKTSFCESADVKVVGGIMKQSMEAHELVEKISRMEMLTQLQEGCAS